MPTKKPTARTRGLRNMQHNKVNRPTLTDASSEINDDSQNIILRGFRVGNRVVMHCPWCDRMHVHGWGPEDDHRVVEWRVAHHGSNPSLPDSYQISVFRPKDLTKSNWLWAAEGRFESW